MQMRLTTARACKAYADELAAAKERDAQVKALLAEGRKQSLFVSRLPSFHQDAARRLLPLFSDDPAERPEPRNFDEAFAAARGAVTDLQETEQLAGKLASQIATESVAAKRTELEKQQAAAQKTIADLSQEAYRLCRLALGLADERSNLDAVNLMRYLLCYFEFQRGNFHDAALLGEFLARRYPASQGARHSAKIAMVSYLRLYEEAAAADSSAQNTAFETNQIIGICDLITRQWPDQEEASEALNTLIPFMIRERKLQEAEDYLRKIPRDSPHRGSAELKTGQALWANYLESSQQIRAWETGSQQKPDDVDLAARKLDLDLLKTRAKQTLVDGVERMRARRRLRRNDRDCGARPGTDLRRYGRTRQSNSAAGGRQVWPLDAAGGQRSGRHVWAISRRDIQSRAAGLCFDARRSGRRCRDHRQGQGNHGCAARAHGPDRRR